MDTVVTAPGSLGDFNPMLGIARQLQRMGRQVLMIGAEPYRDLALRAGLQFHPLVSSETFYKTLEHPDLWDAWRGPRLIFDQMLGESLDRHYAWLEQNCDPERVLLVSHMLDFAGRIYRDRHPECRQASVLLSPSVLRSDRNPPQLTSSGFERRLPPFLVRLLYGVADWSVDRLAGKHINRLRRSLGLPSVKGIVNKWWHSPDLTLVMFPKWFALGDDLLGERMMAIDFPLVDAADVVAPEIEQRLQEVIDTFGGQRPVLVAPGSAHHRAGQLLTEAAMAFEQRQIPAILLSSNLDEIPKVLPPNVVAAKYLPFSRIFPHCSAVVHHGGVGTTSQCFRAGVPQLVLPMAFDQFDNAQRVLQLGCGSWFAKRRVSARLLLKHLEQLPQTAGRVSEVAGYFRTSSDPCQTAATQILRLIDHPNSPNA